MKQLLAISLFLLVFVQGAMAQKYLDVDLSKKNFNETTISVSYNGIRIINKCPQETYKIIIKVEEEKSPNDGDVSSSGDWRTDASLTGFKNALTALLNAKKEAEVPALIKTLNDEFEKVPIDNQYYATVKEERNSLVERTTEKSDFTFDLKKNQNIFITVQRLNSDGKVVDSWEVLAKTPRSVSYISHFGFTFSPSIIKEADQYFSKTTGQTATGTDSFTITKLNTNGAEFWKDLSLTANFLIPIRKNNKGELGNINFAWNGGIGVSGDAKFTVFTGPSVLFADFAAINLGFGVSNSYKLKGEYSPNQGIKENLSFDQLHSKGIRPNILLSLSFRLSKKQLVGEEIEIVGKK